MKKICEILISIFLISMFVAMTTVTTVRIADAVPIEEWNRTFENTCFDTYGDYAQQTKDGGYILLVNGYPKECEYSYSGQNKMNALSRNMSELEGQLTPIKSTKPTGSMTTSIYWSSMSSIIKTNNSGYEQWSATVPSGTQYLNISSDGGYVTIGNTVSPYGSGLSVIYMLSLKINTLGNIQWQHFFATYDQYPIITSIQQKKDGGYVAVGYGTTSNVPERAVLIETDHAGNIQNSLLIDDILDSDNHNHYNDHMYVATSVQTTKDDSYIITGYDNPIDKNIVLYKTGNNGWVKKFEGQKNNEYIHPQYAQQTSDGGYIVIGNIFIKTDNSGNIQWNKTIKNFTATSGQQTLDKGYILTGFKKELKKECSYYDYPYMDCGNSLIKTDSSGNIQWNKKLNESPSHVQQTSDGGYILSGTIMHDGILVARLSKISDKPVNLLKNPGFEELNSSIPRYWSKYQTGIKATFTYPEIGRGGIGKSVAIKYLTRETGKVALWRQQGIIVSPSSQYKLSGYMKLSNVTGGGSLPRYNGAGLRINWYRSDGSLIKVDVINKAGTIGWTKYEKIFTAPSNAVRTIVGGDLFNSSGKVWFDDLSFIRMS